MKKAATTEELQNAIGEHITQTGEHVARLEHVFEMLGDPGKEMRCDGNISQDFTG
jgi:ferritin-like metal-binding protein YciE